MRIEIIEQPAEAKRLKIGDDAQREEIMGIAIVRRIVPEGAMDSQEIAVSNGSTNDSKDHNNQQLQHMPSFGGGRGSRNDDVGHGGILSMGRGAVSGVARKGIVVEARSWRQGRPSASLHCTVVSESRQFMLPATGHATTHL